MDKTKCPVGFFDSGIGGTSIWREVQRLLPNEDTIYLADSINAPYGLRSRQEITDLSFKNTDFLIAEGCKLIVVACNTATTNAIKELRAAYTIPFIGIEPAIKPAAIHTLTGTVGILATKGTLSSELFTNTVSGFKNVRFIEQVGHGLVELIEAGKLRSEEMQVLLEEYLQPMVAGNIDYLVLGCSHYPYLIPQIREILPLHVTIIDSGEAVARQTKNVLQLQNLINTGNHAASHSFYTNGNTGVLQSIIGPEFKAEYKEF